MIDDRRRWILFEIATAATLLLSASCSKDATTGPAPNTTGSVTAPHTNASGTGDNAQMGPGQMGPGQMGPGQMGPGQMGSGPMGPNHRMGSVMENSPALRDGGDVR
jgi:hypothetical protein